MKEALAVIALIAIVAVVGLYSAGWLTIDKGTDRTTIEIKTDQVREATGDAIEKGAEATRQLADEVDEAADNLDEPHIDADAEPIVRDPGVERASPESPVTVEDTVTP